MKFWILKPNYGVWVRSPQPLEAIGGLGAEPPVLAIFVVFLLMYPAF